MTIRPALIFVPLIAIAIGAWWLLTRELLMLQPLRGNLFTTLRLTLFIAPFFFTWRLLHA